MGLRFVYQQQLTKYLVKFYRSSTRYSFSRSEMSVNRMIMYSRLLPDMPTIIAFMGQGLVHLNGQQLPDLSRILVPDDLIQLTVSM